MNRIFINNAISKWKYIIDNNIITLFSNIYYQFDLHF